MNYYSNAYRPNFTLKRTPLCIIVFLFVYYIHTLTDFDRSPIKRPFLREPNGKKYDRSTEGKKHLVVVLQINGFQNGRETREKNICCKVRARMCVCTQFAITTAIKRSTRPARFNVSIAIFTVGIACTPGEYLSMPITHPTTRFERRKLTRFLNNTRDY